MTHLTLDQQKACGRYINRIRNKAKHDYALLYYVWMIGMGPKPSAPANLSPMGSQAVWISLHKLAGIGV